jgi:hypothetical protein
MQQRNIEVGRRNTDFLSLIEPRLYFIDEEKSSRRS